MKKYKEYMDEVKVSDTLHQRLAELDAPKKRSAAWMRYGAVAAVLVLVAGVGAWGLSRHGGGLAEAGHETPDIVPEGEIVAVPDIAVEDPIETLEPGQKTLGGYEVPHDGMVSYYVLPWIGYEMSDTRTEMALDWDVPRGSVERELAQADFAALFGKEENLSVHLGWGGYTLTGRAVWNEDGTLWGFWVNGDAGEHDRFELAVGVGMIPPTCIVYGDDVVTELWDVSVTAWGYDGEYGSDRRVEFTNDGFGYRFDVTGTNGAQTDMLVSRLVRWLIVEGLETDNLSSDGAALVHPWEADPNYSVGEPNWDDGGVDTPAYDPDEAADPAYNAPAVSLDPFAGGQPGEELPVPPDGIPDEEIVVPADPGLGAEGDAVDDTDLDLEAIEPD